MKLVRGAAILVGIADFAFAVAFFLSKGIAPETAGIAEYPRWLGVYRLALAALLFLVVSDPERFFPVTFVVAGAHALVALVAVPAIMRQVHIIVSDGALAAVLVLSIAYVMKQRRSARGHEAAASVPAASDGAKPTNARSAPKAGGKGSEEKSPPPGKKK